MIDLTYKPKKVMVRIDGEEYEIAERSQAIDDALQAHNENLEHMDSYDSSYNLVKILLGEESVKKIFTKERDKENLNRMYFIAKGVDDAYQTEYQEMRDKEYNDTLQKLDNLAQRSKPVIDMIDRSNQVNKKRR